jgi:hypothetical protein
LAVASPKANFTLLLVHAAARGVGQQQAAERESDAHRLAQRQKQIDMGKNTLGYQRYKAAVPRWGFGRPELATW